MLLNELISTILQILVFTLIPFLVYLITHRKAKGFRQYIGLYQAPAKANLYAVAASLIFISAGLILALVDPDLLDMLRAPGTVIGKLRGIGFSTETIILLVLMAGFKTSLSEEIFFRGFVAKRLMNWLGYQWGNIIQAAIFGLIHVLLFWAILEAGSFFLIFIFLLSGIAGYVTGYIKEKVGNGSIIPGWIAHGMGNMISYAIIGFVI